MSFFVELWCKLANHTDVTHERPARAMLTSWKAIARFFDRDARTVQRWEKGEGLPVHRHPHQRQSSVYAFPDELDAWWREHGASLGHEAASAPAKPLLTLRLYMLFTLSTAPPDMTALPVRVRPL